MRKISSQLTIKALNNKWICSKQINCVQYNSKSKHNIKVLIQIHNTVQNQYFAHTKYTLTISAIHANPAGNYMFKVNLYIPCKWS